MTASLTVALNLTTIMAVVVVLVTPMKMLLEIAVPATNRGHDAAVQLLALVIGVVISLIVVWAEGPMTRSAQLEIVVSVLLGLGAGSAGIGVYHVASTVTKSVPPPPPPKVRAVARTAPKEPPAPPASPPSASS